MKIQTGRDPFLCRCNHWFRFSQWNNWGNMQQINHQAPHSQMTFWCITIWEKNNSIIWTDGWIPFDCLSFRVEQHNNRGNLEQTQKNRIGSEWPVKGRTESFWKRFLQDTLFNKSSVTNSSESETDEQIRRAGFKERRPGSPDVFYSLQECKVSRSQVSFV